MTLQSRIEAQLGALRIAAELEVDPGEVVAVLGPNGAGKTTLLRVLAGLVPLRAGRIVLGGKVLEDPASGVSVPAEKRRVGMVFQDYLLFPHLSVLDNVAFGLRARGVPRHEARRRARDWLERMGVGSVARRKPRAVSGGQAQRVALARALVTEPGLLLLDEPLAALDLEARVAVRRHLRAHLDAFPGACIVVTHEPLEAMALADRLVVLEQGRVVQSGTVAQVTQRPRSLWAARLAGVNLFRGHGAEGSVELASGVVLHTPTPATGDVFAVVHPRAVALHRLRPEGTPRNVWHGHVTGLDAHGDRVRVQVSGPVVIVAEVTPAAVAELELGSGGMVWVSVKASEVDLYPV